MRVLAIRFGLGAAACAALFVACNQRFTNVTQTQQISGDAVLVGPDSVAPGQSARFAVQVRMSDGTVKEPSPSTRAQWFSSNDSVFHVDSNGLVTASQTPGEAILSVSLTVGSRPKNLSKVIDVMPDGTFRVAGFVTEADPPHLPVPGAHVTVTPGSLATTTASDGRYTLFGVPATGTLQVALDGYQTVSIALQLSANATQNVQLQLSLTGSPLNLSGNYALAVDVVGACANLPADLQHRRYDAVLTQNGTEVDVLLTEPRFKLGLSGKGNGFSGRARAASVTFTLDDFDSYYYYYNGPSAYPSVAERLSDGTILVPAGVFTLTGSAASLSGSANGFSFLSHWTSAFPHGAFLNGCSGTPILGLTLTQR